MRTLATLAAGTLLLATATAALGQPGGPLENLGGPLGGDFDALPKVQVRAEFTPPTGDRPAILFVTANILPEWHIYSLTQPLTERGAGPRKTVIDLDDGHPYRLAGPFRPLSRPDTKVDTVGWPGLQLETHEGSVTWYAPLELAPGADYSSLEVSGVVKLQVCQDDGQCVPLTLPFTAKQGKGFEIPDTALADLASSEAAIGSYREDESNVEVRGSIEPKVVQPGETVELQITVAPNEGYHTYPWQPKDPREVGKGKPTLIVLEQTQGWNIGKPKTDAPVATKQIEFPGQPPDSEEYHQGTVTWTIPVEVPRDAEPGRYNLAGLVGYMVCQENLCDPPEGAKFVAQVTVGSETKSGQQPALFYPGRYVLAAKAAADLATDDTQMADTGTAAPAPEVTPKQEDQEAIAKTPGTEPGDPEVASTDPALERSFLAVLGLAFVGGLILNIMPCVLPVIGLKIFVFMEQGSENRGKTFALNVAYAAGVISVFLVLALLAAVFRLGWGQLFQYPEFSIAMSAVIFTMGLSFIGIWEIPIPGFIGTGKVTEIGEKEGYEGAFAKGTITTLLATPCTGPFMATALVGVLGRPPVEIFTIFFVIGLGMASPYLIIGAFPELVRFLPKPGEWMNTFKQIMGFVLIGTVVYLLTTIKPYYVVPTVAFLFGLWLACWWVGRVPFTAGGGSKWKALGEATLMSTVIGLTSFLWLAPVMAERQEFHVERKIALAKEQWFEEGNFAYSVENKPWQPFTERKLEWLRENNKTVLVDFTADWCPNCKVMERTVLKTDSTAEVLDEYGVYTLVADWTHREDATAVTELLDELKVKNIPLVAIFPAKNPDEPILIPGTYTSSQLYAKIREAGHSLESDDSANGRIAQRPRPVE